MLALWVAPDRHADPGTSYRSIWISEFFNRSVGRVVEVGAPMPYDLPHSSASIRSRILRGSDGAPIESNYLLAPCWVKVAGAVVASDRRARAVVYRLARRPIRVEMPVGRSGCALDAGQIGLLKRALP